MKENTRVLASNLSQHLNERVVLKGWLHSLRRIGKQLNFLILRDGSGLAQIVLTQESELQTVVSLQPGSVLYIEGTVRATDQAALKVEVVDPTIHVEVPVLVPPIIDYCKPDLQADLDVILDNRPITLRHQKIQAVFKIQAEIVHAYRLFMHDVVKAVEYFSPNIVGSSSEGGAEFFNVDYYGYVASLAQSSQLYKQIMVGVNERVFSLAPFFRAENSNTKRHLAEGKQFEFEMGFFEDWTELMDVQESCLKFIVKYLHTNCAKEIAILGNSIVQAPGSVPFPRLTFIEALELYYKRTGIDERHENDLSPAAEKDLCAYALQEHGTDFIFITDWKESKRPFYSFPKKDELKLTNTFDLLCAGTEITSGGQRCHTHASMVEGILAKGMDPANFEDYLSIFKYGMPPHGGFGMGLERLTMTLLHLDNIREASLFPSDPKRIAGKRLKAKIFFGGENIRGEIIRLLKHHEIAFQHVVHPFAASSENSAALRDTPLEIGIKSIILKGKSSKKNYQVNIPAHLKLDMKAVALEVGEKCEFESPEVIQERFGLTVGGVPPFGSLIDLENIFDHKIKELEEVAFNCGLPTESIKVKGKDLYELISPKWALIAKES
jgi:nondiscriminating aspartyl-tRNA synthetase